TSSLTPAKDRPLSSERPSRAQTSARTDLVISAKSLLRMCESAHSAVASMQKVRTRGDHRAFLLSRNKWSRRFSGTTRFCLLAISAWLASAAGTVRPDDHPTARGYDALPDEGTIGGAIGIVFITAPTIVAIPRADAATERAAFPATPAPPGSGPIQPGGEAGTAATSKAPVAKANNRFLMTSSFSWPSHPNASGV